MFVQKSAIEYPFLELVDLLETEIQKGYIDRKQGFDNLTLYNYTPKCQFDRAWNDITLQARGLILHCPTEQVVGISMPKFFNYGELNFDLPEGNYFLTEKLDGSLGIIFYWKDRHVATRGSFESDQAQWAEAWLYNKITRQILNQRTTYNAEIIYPENRIVVKYDYSGLAMITAYDLDTGRECDIYQIRSIGQMAGFMLPKVYLYTIGELEALLPTLDYNHEGFVLQTAQGRIKLKGDEYLRVHRIVSGVTPLRIWDLLLNFNKEQIEKIQEMLPEEYLVDFNTIVSIYEKTFATIMTELREAENCVKELSNKELGLLFQQDKIEKTSQNSKLGQCSEIARALLFLIRRYHIFDEDDHQFDESSVKLRHTIYDMTLPEKVRTAVFKWFRPKDNYLEGYVPSGAMHRVFDNSEE